MFLLIFNQWADELIVFEIVLLFGVLVWTIIFTVLLCESGARMTNQFDEFSEELSRCDWYAVSIKMQRLYMIFFSDTQNPIKLESYANVTCERETTKTVIHFWIHSNLNALVFHFIFRLSTNHFHTL